MSMTGPKIPQRTIMGATAPSSAPVEPSADPTAMTLGGDLHTCGYIAMWKGKRVEITQDAELGIYHAKLEAAKQMNVPVKKQHEIIIGLAEKDGKPVIHTAVD